MMITTAPFLMTFNTSSCLLSLAFAASGARADTEQEKLIDIIPVDTVVRSVHFLILNPESAL